MRYFLVFSAALLALAAPVQAQTRTYSTSGITIPQVEAYDSDGINDSGYRSTRNNSNIDKQNAEIDQQVQDSLGDATYRMDENGFLVPVEGQNLLGGQQKDKPFNQKVNNPNKQVYKGAEANKQPLVAKRTHRMYEDTIY